MEQQRKHVAQGPETRGTGAGNTWHRGRKRVNVYTSFLALWGIQMVARKPSGVDVVVERKKSFKGFYR